MNWNEIQMALRALPFLDAHANSPGRMFQLRTEPERKLLVWQPEVIEWIFRNDPEFGHPGSRAMRLFLGDRSMFWMDGERHAAYRRMLGPPLRGRALLGYRELISTTAHSAIDRWSAGDVIGLSDWSRNVVLRIVAQIVLGKVDDAVLTRFMNWMDDALGSQYRMLRYRYVHNGLPRASAELGDSLLDAARTAAAETDRQSMARLLLSGDGPLGELDDDEVRDQIVSLLFAGHETTASAVAMALYLLDRHERVCRDVLDELSATSDDGSDATAVPLLHAVVQETLRLAPPVPAAWNRALPEECEVSGRRLEAGSVLAPSVYLAHRDPEHFPNPRRFDPQRFLTGQTPPRAHYFPFGGGGRHCLGRQLAQLEIRMIVAAVLRRREWTCVNPRAGKPTLRVHTVALPPKLRVRVTRSRD